jgi:hypothetical protein
MPSLCCLVGVWGFPNKTYAQTALSCNEITEQMGFTIHSVKIEGDWVPQSLQQEINKKISIGQRYSPTVIEEARTAIKSELKKQQQSEPIIWATYIDSDTCRVFDEANSKQVDIIFHPYHVQVNLISVGDNVLPIPSVTTPTFSARVPSELLPASSIVSFLNDRNYGSSLSVKTTTNLLNLTPNTTTDSNNGAESLNLNLEGRHSFSQPFYNVNMGLD